MRNHFLALLLTLMMICSLVTASALADYSAEAIYTERDGYLQIRHNSVFSEVDHLYYLLNEEGDVISSEDGYTDVDSAYFSRSSANSCDETVYHGFIVTDKDGKKGLLLPDGTMAVPCMYDDVMVRSERWQIGVTLHPSAEGEEKDYSNGWFGGGDKSWTITQADVYYCGSLCFTVDGKDFSGGYSHYNNAYGDYICITDRSGKYIWYGRDGKKTDGDDSTHSEYEEGKHAATGTKAFSKKCTLTDEEVYACYNYDSKNGDIITLSGKTLGIVSKADRSKYSNSVSPFRGDYFLLSGNSGSYVVGLFDLSGKLVIGDLPSKAVCWTDEWLSVEDSQDSDNVRIGFARMAPSSDIQYYTIGKAYSDVYGSWASYHEKDSDKYYVITASAGKLPLEFKYIHGHAGTEVFTAVPYDSSSYRENLYDLNGNIILEEVSSLSDDGTLAVSENRLYRISK